MFDLLLFRAAAFATDDPDLAFRLLLLAADVTIDLAAL